MRVLLVGDSSIDNKLYVNTAIVEQARTKLTKEFGQEIQVELLAQDGAVIEDIPAQVQNIRVFTDDIMVVSVGGNDALGYSDIMYADDPLHLVVEYSSAFEEKYFKMTEHLTGLVPASSLCLATIYNPNFTGIDQKIGTQALKFFNDSIVRAAAGYRTGLILNHSIFNDPKDYANSIEPSERGGAKFIKAVSRFIEGERIIGENI